MTSEAVPTVGALIELLRQHDVPDDARLIGEPAQAVGGNGVFLVEVKIRSDGKSSVTLRVGEPLVVQR